MTSKHFRKSLLSLFLIAVLTFTLAFSPLVTRVLAVTGTLTSAKVTISDSHAGQASVGHTFDFTTATTGTIATVVFQYCNAASGACVTPTGLVTTGGSQGSLTGLGASTSDFTTNGTITLTVTSPASVSNGTSITVPFTGITNPTTADTTFFVRITTQASGPTAIDTNTTAFAILTSTSIAVTASIDPTLTFTVAGVDSGGTVNSSSLTITTTASTIPFGTLTAATPAIGAQDVTVVTNALNGYIVSAKAAADPPLTDVNNNIDKFSASYSSPATWSSPGGTTASVNTGFFGYTTEDTNVSGFSGNKWAAVDTTARTLVSSSTGVTTRTKRIGWQTEVNTLQPSGSYSGTVILVATPTY